MALVSLAEKHNSIEIDGEQVRAIFGACAAKKIARMFGVSTATAKLYLARGLPIWRLTTNPEALRAHLDTIDAHTAAVRAHLDTAIRGDWRDIASSARAAPRRRDGCRARERA